MNNNYITFKDLLDIIKPILEIKKPILLRGKHGIGKSELVYQIADTIVQLPLIERRASQMADAGDLVGLPKLGEESTNFLPPDWFLQACREGVVLFLDELNRADIGVRQAIFQLTDSRSLNGHQLHPETVIFSAVNSIDDGYQVGAMGHAEIDRWVVFDVSPSVKDWMDWGKRGNIIPDILEFIADNEKHLEHKGIFEPEVIYPSRRSWKRLSDVLENTDLLEGSSPLLYNLSFSFIGSAAVEFNKYVGTLERVTPEDIVYKGKLHKVKDFTIVEHTAMLEKMRVKKIYEKVFTEEQLANWVNYTTSIPAELFMGAYADLGKGGGAVVDGKEVGHINTQSLQQVQLRDGKKLFREWLIDTYQGRQS